MYHFAGDLWCIYYDDAYEETGCLIRVARLRLFKKNGLYKRFFFLNPPGVTTKKINEEPNRLWLRQFPGCGPAGYHIKGAQGQRRLLLPGCSSKRLLVPGRAGRVAVESCGLCRCARFTRRTDGFDLNFQKAVRWVPEWGHENIDMYVQQRRAIDGVERVQTIFCRKGMQLPLAHRRVRAGSECTMILRSACRSGEWCLLDRRPEPSSPLQPGLLQPGWSVWNDSKEY